jgi:3',5'-cyclic-AMP phosphodiesterase
VRALPAQRLAEKALPRRQWILAPAYGADIRSGSVAISCPRDEKTMLKRIAHLSDVHILEARPNPSPLHNLSVQFVSLARPLDAKGRTRKLRRGLAAARKAGADHFVISGDLTEVGTPDQFEAFAEELAASAIEPERFTLVPGNHDAYTSGEAWRRALEGPLRPYASGAAVEPGKVVERGDIVLLPIDVSVFQSIARSAGELSPANGDALEHRLDDPAFGKKAIVVVQHHQPFAHARSAWQWIDGLRGTARIMDLLARHPRVSVLHGHMHRVVDRIVGLGMSRIFGAPAIVEDAEGQPRVRLYDVRDGTLEAVGMCPAA